MIFLIVAFNICFYFFIQFSMYNLHLSVLVGLSGLEPPTSRLSGVRSNRLSYKPILFRTLSVFLRGSAFNLSQPISSRMKSAIHGNCFPLSRPIQFVSRSFFTAGRAAHFRVLVEINGIEPLTSCLQSRRSPS